MKNIQQIKDDTAQKYLQALKELHSILRYTNKISLLPFCKSKGLSKNTPYIMQQGGLIKNVGKKGRGASYEWVTIEPNLEMARELHKRVLIASNEATNKSRSLSKEKSDVKTINQIDLNNEVTNTDKFPFNKILSSETKLLWGLITIKTKYTFE